MVNPGLRGLTGLVLAALVALAGFQAAPALRTRGDNPLELGVEAVAIQPSPCNGAPDAGGFCHLVQVNVHNVSPSATVDLGDVPSWTGITDSGLRFGASDVSGSQAGKPAPLAPGATQSVQVTFYTTDPEIRMVALMFDDYYDVGSAQLPAYG
jgi:hypothetical protein